MNLDKMKREELIKIIKRHTVMCIEDYDCFKTGERYFLDTDEGGQYIIDDNGKYHDMYDLSLELWNKFDLNAN